MDCETAILGSAKDVLAFALCRDCLWEPRISTKPHEASCFLLERRKQEVLDCEVAILGPRCQTMMCQTPRLGGEALNMPLRMRGWRQHARTAPVRGLIEIRNITRSAAKGILTCPANMESKTWLELQTCLTLTTVAKG